jgi:carbon-monoxide dehydrogenase large subunit
MPYTVVGKPVGRVEGPEKVRGEARYAADWARPGRLWGKALRSPVPHARIVRIDPSAARGLPGVHAVLTAADLPDILVGRQMFDMPLLAQDRVRFVGEKVAAVAAEDPELAEEAAGRITVEYEELPAVFDALEALGEGAPVLHADPGAYAFAPKERPHPNVQSVLRYRLGDPDRGFREAAHVFEHTFRTPRGHQGYLEPTAGFVAIDPDGRVQVWASNKMPFRLRELLAHAIQLPPERIVVNPCPIGGDFGGKGSLMDVPLCYYLARATGRPVKMVMTYVEELTAGNPRHASVITLRSGVAADGRLLARTARAVFDGGAYAAFKPVPHVNLNGAALAQGVYRIPHMAIESLCVYTNNVPCGHMRSPGEPQMSFAVESHTDMIAAALGLDPAEFRRRNLLGEGDHLVTGHHVERVRARETLEAALRAAGWATPKPRPTIGRGIAMSHRHVGIGRANAGLTLQVDGTAVLLTVVPDTGTGSLTILQQVVAEVLGLPLAAVRVQVGTTDAFATDSGAGGSRVTHVAGQAAYRAATEVRHRILAEAAAVLGLPAEALDLAGGVVRAGGDAGRSLPLADLAARAAARGEAIEARIHYDAREFPAVHTFCAQVAEVEVDRETGQVRLLRIVSAHDAGTVINPLGHQGQIEGGLIQGLGFALMEELGLAEGRVTTASLGDFKLPTTKDIPPLTTVILEDPAGPGPFNAKSIGESSNVPVAGAIANAVADACGARITSVPITAEKVHAALAGGGQEASR